MHLEFDPDSGAEFFTHIDYKNQTENARVELKLGYGEDRETFTVIRYVNSPNKFKLNPDTPQTRKVFAELSAQHQLVLSRLNLLNFVKAQPITRAEMLETVLEMEGITREREKLAYKRDRERAKQNTAKDKFANSQDILTNLFGTSVATDEDFLAIVNQYRKTIYMEPLVAIPANLDLLSGSDRKESYFKSNLDIIEFRLRKFVRFLSNVPKLGNVEVKIFWPV